MPSVKLGFKSSKTNVDGGMSGTRSKLVPNVEGVTGGRVQVSVSTQIVGIPSTHVDGVRQKARIDLM